MIKKIIILTIVFFKFTIVNAQFVTPLEGDYLNYTDIIFEVDQIDEANNYLFTFYECNKRGENCKEIKNVKSKIRAIKVFSFFNFNKTYKWNFIAFKNKTEIYKSRSITFQTGNSPLLDSNIQKWEWTVKNKKRKNGILLIDGLKLALNMQGKPVFYLNYNFDHTVRDINITKQGTVTLVDNRLGEIKEVSLKGEMLWIGPEVGNRENMEGDKFHHEFEKLPNLNYIVAGKRKLENIETNFSFSNISNKTVCETIIEFDAEKNEVWRFNLLPELKRQFNIAPTSQMFNPDRLGHLNGLAIDDKKNIIYASFKTFSSVFKIDKETNNILYMFGNKTINFNDSTQSTAAFQQQHCPILLPNGNLMVLNNGTEKTGSGIVELNNKPNLDSTNEVVKSIYFKSILKKDFYTAQMGSVQYIDKKNVLVGLGNATHLFELNTKKRKINWQIYTFQNIKFNENGKVWKPLISYRVYYYTSLFPYYFIVNKLNNGLEIVNIGSEKESFIIEFFDKEGNLQTTNNVEDLKPNKIFNLKNSTSFSKAIIKEINSKKSIEILFSN